MCVHCACVYVHGSDIYVCCRRSCPSLYYACGNGCDFVRQRFICRGQHKAFPVYLLRNAKHTKIKQKKKSTKRNAVWNQCWYQQIWSIKHNHSYNPPPTLPSMHSSSFILHLPTINMKNVPHNLLTRWKHAIWIHTLPWKIIRTRNDQIHQIYRYKHYVCTLNADRICLCSFNNCIKIAICNRRWGKNVVVPNSRREQCVCAFLEWQLLSFFRPLRKSHFMLDSSCVLWRILRLYEM